MKLSDLKVKLFTDGADKAQIVEMAEQALDQRASPPTRRC